MSESKVGYKNFIVDTKDGSYVIVSHHELDSLVGRLMQMCDLIGDLEQKNALKNTIKNICREWLDTEYESTGYDRWTGAKVGSRYIDAADSNVVHELFED